MEGYSKARAGNDNASTSRIVSTNEGVAAKQIHFHSLAAIEHDREGQTPDKVLCAYNVDIHLRNVQWNGGLAIAPKFQEHLFDVTFTR